VIICKRGKPVAQLDSYERSLRKPGAWKGKVRIGPDFDKADKEIEKLFYGE